MINKAITYKNVDGKNVLGLATWDNDSYNFLRTNVGGYIERVCLPMFDDKGIDMWCNEEGKFDSSLKPSILLTNCGKPYDVIVGGVVFTRCDDDGNTISLTDDDVKYIKDCFKDGCWAFAKDGSVIKAFDFKTS